MASRKCYVDLDLNDCRLLNARLDLPQVAQGRLTLGTGQPLLNTGQAAKTTLYYSPWKGNGISLWDGSRWRDYDFAELSLSLAGLTASVNHDIFCHDATGSGGLTLTAVAWTNDTTRSAAVGFQNGVPVKGADARLLLGTIRTSATGQTETSRAKQFVNNVYNRIPAPLQIDDSSASWGYTTQTWRQARATPANKVEWVCSLESFVHLANSAYMQTTSAPGWISIGYDSITAPSVSATVCVGPSASGVASSNGSLMAEFDTQSTEGYHYAAMLELGGTGNTFYGTSLSQTLQRMVGFVMA